MKATKFPGRIFSYVLLLNLCLAYSLFGQLHMYPFVLLGGELLIILSVYWVYHALNPVAISDIFVLGMEAIRAKDFSTKFALSGEEETDRFITIYNDIIDELRSERTRQMEQQQFIKNFIEVAPMGVILFDFDDEAVLMNSSAKEILLDYGRATKHQSEWELASLLLSSVTDLADGAARSVKTKAKVFKIQKSYVMDRGFRRIFLIIHEISKELHESEKKTYDTLIRMMAHEVNNTIGAINSILDTARSVVRDDGHHELSNALRVGLERNNKCCLFMERLSDLAKLPKPNKQSIDMNVLVKDIGSFMRPSIEVAGIVLNISHSQAPVFREIDVGQFEQLLINVIKNAVDACVAQCVIELEVTDSLLIIRNNGMAIPEEIMDRLFDPFFSNKPNGQGIGLTIARSILASHGLLFSLQTDADGWTKFSVHHSG